MYDEGKMKKDLRKSLIAMVATTACVATTGCSKEEKVANVELTALQEQVAYTEAGDPVDPLTLVTITRKGSDKSDQTKETMKADSSKDESDAKKDAKSSNDDKGSKDEKTSDDSKSDSETEDKTATDEKTDSTETKAYIEDGLEVTKVYPEVIDTSKVGEVTVYYTVKDTDDDSEAELSHTFEVVDESAPAFKLKDSKATVKVGSEFKPESYIKNDAGLTKVDTEPEDGAEFENGWYTINSNVDTKKAGTYTVKYHAVGNNGVASDIELKVTVEEDKDKKEEKTSDDSNQTAASKADTSGSTSSNSGNSNSGNSGTAAVTQPAQNNDASAVTGNNMYNGVVQTPGCTTTTVHHDAITKETSYQEWVEDKPAWTEHLQKCNSCGKVFSTDDEAALHAMETTDNGDMSHTWSGYDVYHDAEGHYETKTKTEVIVSAYDQQVCQ